MESVIFGLVFAFVFVSVTFAIALWDEVRDADWAVVIAIYLGVAGASMLGHGYLTRPTRVEVSPDVIVETFDPTLQVYATFWQREIARRFHGAVGVLVHGGDFVEGQWIVGTSLQPREHVIPTADLVREVQRRYPGRTIVLLACNPGHLRLGIPGVYYAKSSVWCVPDRELTPEMFTNAEARRTFDSGYDGDSAEAPGNRWHNDPEFVGNIFEFVED